MGRQNREYYKKFDDIVDRELKFFVLAEEYRWGFTVVPVLRRDGQLYGEPRLMVSAFRLIFRWVKSSGMKDGLNKARHL